MIQPPPDVVPPPPRRDPAAGIAFRLMLKATTFLTFILGVVLGLMGWVGSRSAAPCSVFCFFASSADAWRGAALCGIATGLLISAGFWLRR